MIADLAFAGFSRYRISALQKYHRDIFYIVCIRSRVCFFHDAEFFEKSKSETHQNGNYVSLDFRACRHKNTLLSLETVHI